MGSYSHMQYESLYLVLTPHRAAKKGVRSTHAGIELVLSCRHFVNGYIVVDWWCLPLSYDCEKGDMDALASSDGV